VISNAPEKLQECFSLLVDSVLALQRENKEILWGSMVKETMKRKKPSFNETYYGFRTFSHLLEDAQRRGVVVLRRDQRSGSYIVEDLGTAATTAGSRGDSTTSSVAAPSAAAPPSLAGAPPAALTAAASTTAPEATGEAADGTRGRRRRGRGRRGGRATSPLAAGAYMDPNNPSGGHLEEEDDDDDDITGEEAETAGSNDRDAHHDARPAGAAGRTADAGRSSPTEPASAHDRGSFSFFSWLRRDQPAEEEPPAGGRKPDR
jgi:hypothetical protein